MRKFRVPIVIVILAGLFHFVPFFDGAEAWAVGGLMTVAAGARGAALGISGFFTNAWRASDLAARNEELKRQLAESELRGAEASALSAENESLKAMLEFRKRSSLNLIPARVVGADPDATVRAVVIDCGSEEGIARGDAVIYGRGIYLGKIERVSAGRASVLLPTDPRSSLAVMPADHPEADGLAQGEKGLVISMSLIPQHSELETGEAVVTTGRQEGIPRGLLVGSIEHVSGALSDPFLSATIIPAIDPLTVTAVAVVHAR